jgi:D-serine deaminase-like pyridoxal phosphate-dependent protein
MQTTRRSFMAAAAFPAIAGSATRVLAAPGPQGAQRSSRAGLQPGPGDLEHMLERGSLVRADIPSPALLLDLDAFEWNVATMAGYLKARSRGFRPHGKTHKCPEIAKALARAGALGSCVAKLSEAEVFAAHGIGGLLVTTAVVGRRKVERAVTLAAAHRDIVFVADDPQQVRDLNDAAAALKASPPLRVNVAVDLLFGRTGIAPGRPALDLARQIGSLPHVRFAGLQAYDGTASHTVGFDARAARSRETMGQAVETRRLVEQDGIACAFVSSGSTGTYNIDSEIDGITELQPGSFMFMDIDYSRIGGRQGPVYADFRTALTVVTTVVSRRPNVAIVDGGFKAFSTDRAFAPQAKDLDGVTYAWAGDEHGRLDLTSASRDVKLGDRLEFVVPHCDPSVNLYDRIYGLRGDQVEAVWPIAARGMSQ